MKAINKIREQKNLSKYDFGGWVKDKALTASLGPAGWLGDAISGGKLSNYLNENSGTYLTAAGAVGGALAGNPMIGMQAGQQANNMLGFEQDKLNAQNRKLKANQIISQNESIYTRGYPSTNINQNELRQMAHGGYSDANAELEKGEPFRTPDGKIYKVSDNAPTHAQGGVQLNLPQGTEILGKNTIMGQQFKKLGSSLKRAQDRADKILNEPSTNLSRQTALRNLNNVQRQWDSLMNIQESQKAEETMGKYPTGGSIKSYSKKNLNTFERVGTDYDEMYSYKFNPNDSTLHEKYYYGKPDSTFMFERLGNQYYGEVNKPNSQPIIYDESNPIPAEALKRTNTAIKNIKQYPTGGKVTKSVEEFNKKYGTDYVSLGDFTKYNMGQGTASQDYEKLLQMMTSQPNYQQLEKRAEIAGIQKDINAVQNLISNPVKPYEYNEREELENAAQKMYAKGGKIKKYSTGGWSKEEVSWMNNLPDSFYEGFAKSQPKIAGQDVSYDIPALKKYTENVLSGQDKYLGGNEWSSYPAMKNYYQNDYSKNYTIAGRSKNTLAPMVPKSMYQDKGVQESGISGKMPISSVDPNALAPVRSNAPGTVLNTDKFASIGNAGWQDYLMGAGIAAPALYNLVRGLFEKSARLDANKYRNPYESEALGALRNNKYNYDIDPILREIRTGNNIADYNSKNYSRSTGEMLNRMQANVAQRNRSVTDAYTQKYNIENQANMQSKNAYANALLGAGQNRAANTQNIDMWNMQADAAKRNMIGTALSQGQQGIQQYIGMRNQNRNDQLRMAALQQALQNYNMNPALYGQILQAGIMGGGNWNWNQPILTTK